jgi:hypothetical protein
MTLSLIVMAVVARFVWWAAMRQKLALSALPSDNLPPGKKLHEERIRVLLGDTKMGDVRCVIYTDAIGLSGASGSATLPFFRLRTVPPLDVGLPRDAEACDPHFEVVETGHHLILGLSPEGRRCLLDARNAGLEAQLDAALSAED